MESKEATQKGRQGEQFVFAYLDRMKYYPKWVKNGYDITATVNGEEQRIEVKTTKNSKPTIPDMNITEFEGTLETIPESGRMKATHLYIVTGWGEENVEHKIYVFDTKYVEKHVMSGNTLVIKHRVSGAQLNKLCQKYSREISL